MDEHEKEKLFDDLKRFHKSNVKRLRDESKRIRHAIINMIGYGEGKAGHLGGSCSIADIISVLYYDQMYHDPDDPSMPDRDRLILSKGHAVLAQYAALAECGYFLTKELSTVKLYGSRLQGHPDKNKTPGIEANTGSLGQGLSIGLGMALGLRLSKIPAQVYVIIGDGELAEGQIWEAAMAAAAYKVGNLIVILDDNKIQATGAAKDILDLGDINAKWEAFGWRVMDIDGHNVEHIINAISFAKIYVEGPILIHAHTIKGKGVSFAENSAAFHNAAITKEQFDQAHEDIDRVVKRAYRKKSEG